MDEAQTRRYPGATEAACLSAFTADASLAAADGWTPSAQVVESDPAGNPVFAVTYVRRGSALGTDMSLTETFVAMSASPPPPVIPPPAPAAGASTGGIPGWTASAQPPPQPPGRGAGFIKPLAIAGVVLLFGGAAISGNSTGVVHGFFLMLTSFGLGLLFAASGLFAWSRATWRRGLRIGLTALAALFVVSAVGSGLGQLSNAGASSVPITLTSHNDGQEVPDAQVAIKGTAAPGALIVLHIAMAQDDSVVADGTGAWSMPVTLTPGDNKLVLRVGDDRSTAVMLRLTLAVAAAATSAPSTPSPITTQTPAAPEISQAPTTPEITQAPATPKITESPTPEPTVDVWLRDAAVSVMEGQGFSGNESPLADGTPRWLGKDSSSNMAEAIGKDQLSSVSLTVIANAANGELLGRFVNTWCVPGMSWVRTTIGGYGGVDLDESKSFSGCSVHLQTLTASDGALVIVSIDR